MPPEPPAPSAQTVEPSPTPYASIGDRFFGVAVDALVAFGLFFSMGMLIAPRGPAAPPAAPTAR
jgi:hypothetical protein